jgi:hypothetical protein
MLGLLLVLLAAPASQDARLVCSMDEKLVVLTSLTGAKKPLEPQPPKPPVALAPAGDTLVGVSADGAVMQLREGQWRELTKLGDEKSSKRPLRMDSRYGQGALIWLRGNDPGTIPGVVGVTPKGEIRRYDSAAARKIGNPFRAAPRSLGEADMRVPPGVGAADGGPAPELVFNEPSPWGGRLVAGAAKRGEGDLPAGPLMHFIPSQNKTVKLTFEGHDLDFKGAVAYGPGEVLLIDGAAAGVGRRVLIAGSDGNVRAVPGVEPPCTWWPAPAAAAR